eukprot:6126996-Prymnesium_polylepis.1
MIATAPARPPNGECIEEIGNNWGVRALFVLRLCLCACDLDVATLVADDAVETFGQTLWARIARVGRRKPAGVDLPRIPARRVEKVGQCLELEMRQRDGHAERHRAVVAGVAGRTAAKAVSAGAAVPAGELTVADAHAILARETDVSRVAHTAVAAARTVGAAGVIGATSAIRRIRAARRAGVHIARVSWAIEVRLRPIVRIEGAVIAGDIDVPVLTRGVARHAECAVRSGEAGPAAIECTRRTVVCNAWDGRDTHKQKGQNKGDGHHVFGFWGPNRRTEPPRLA